MIRSNCLKRMVALMVLFLMITAVSMQTMAKWDGYQTVETLYHKNDIYNDGSINKTISKNEISTIFNLFDTFPEYVTSDDNTVAEPGRRAKVWGVTFTYVKLKKVGTTIIRYNDFGGVQGKWKLTVKKYVNPFSSLKMNNKSITGKFNKRSVLTLSYKKYKNKKIRFNFSTKSGWYIKNYRKRNVGSGNVKEYKNGSKVKITSKKNIISFYARNNKRNQDVFCEIFFK